MITGPSHLRNEEYPVTTRVLAIPVALTFVLDLTTKSTANLVEVLWTCYWASALIAIGLMIDSKLLVSSGFIFQAAVGGPAWTLGVIYYRDTQLMSVLLHVIPPLAGLLYVFGMSDLPKAAPAIAWLLHPVSLFASLLWRNESLNVNFSSAVWPPLSRYFSLPVFQGLLLLASILLVLAMSWLHAVWISSKD